MRYFAYSQKEFVYKYIVMLTDIDQFQHMSFANYLRLMFLATDALLVSCATPEFLSKHRLWLVNSSMQFKHQCVSGDNVLIKINSTGMRSSEFTLLYTFVIEGAGRLVGLGRQSYAVLEHKNGKQVETPKQIVELLKPIEVDEDNLLYRY